MTPEQLKHKFEKNGKTFAGWARDNGYVVNKATHHTTQKIIHLFRKDKKWQKQ